MLQAPPTPPRLHSRSNSFVTIIVDAAAPKRESHSNEGTTVKNKNNLSQPLSLPLSTSLSLDLSLSPLSLFPRSNSATTMEEETSPAQQGPPTEAGKEQEQEQEQETEQVEVEEGESEDDSKDESDGNEEEEEEAEEQVWNGVDVEQILKEQEEADREWEEYLRSRQPANEGVITFKMIVDRNTAKHAGEHAATNRDAGSEQQLEQTAEELLSLTRVRLDGEGIRHIDNLECLGPRVASLYLNNNFISKIHNLECLPFLKALILAHNSIDTWTDIRCVSA